ncbi:MAG: energy transducer TonB [Methylococcales bacterium]|nr:energy transducer TonB [Methylococcales bacterium]
MATNIPKHSFLKPAVSVNDSLLMTMFIAAVIHVLVLLSIRFGNPEQQKVSRQIEVTLATLPSEKAPEKAKYLAQENQMGSGTELNKPEPSKLKLASQGDRDDKLPNKRQSQAESKPKKVEKIITQKQADYKIATVVKEAPLSEKKRPKISIEALRNQIAELGAEIRDSQKSSENTQVKHINSVSTHKYVMAQYIKDWETKIEHIATLNTLPETRGLNKVGILILRVDINSDGSVYKMKITRSSGSVVIDDYAKRLVKLGAPYPVLPKTLLNGGNVLSIIRKWGFRDVGVEIQ